MLRVATRADVPAIGELMRRSVLDVFPHFHDERETAAAARYLTEPDTVLIDDGTYFVCEAEGQLVACGGWSKRDKLYTGSGAVPGEDRRLDPKTEPARVRAMFVRGDWTRRGLARAILEQCAETAKAEGFRTLVLMATLPGVPLYRAFGFRELGAASVPLPNGVVLDGASMEYRLADGESAVLHIAEQAEVEVVPGASLRMPIVLALGALSVVSWDGDGDYEQYLLRTNGNSWGLWTGGDEFRFNVTTGLLESLAMHLPEDNITDPDVAAPWLATEPVVGLPRRDDPTAFRSGIAELRWCANDGSVVLALYDNATGEPSRLRVTDQFDLLFADGRLAGWLLENPERHLATESYVPQPPDPELAVLLRRYYDLIDQLHMIEFYEDEHPEGRKLLTDLRNDIALDRGATHRRAVLAQRLQELEDLWYGTL